MWAYGRKNLRLSIAMIFNMNYIGPFKKVPDHLHEFRNPTVKYILFKRSFVGQTWKSLAKHENEYKKEHNSKRIHFADNFWLQIHNYNLHMYMWLFLVFMLFNVWWHVTGSYDGSFSFLFPFIFMVFQVSSWLLFFFLSLFLCMKHELMKNWRKIFFGVFCSPYDTQVVCVPSIEPTCANALKWMKQHRRMFDARSR